MHHYGVRDVEKMLRLPRSTIRALIDAGFVAPARGPRNTYLFSFQDLIVLRTAQTLAAAKIPAKRINRSLKELRKQLPETMPLSGLSIGAIGESIVVRDGATQRQVESGQYLLSFEGDPRQGALSVIERKVKDAAAPAHPAPAALARPCAAQEWFERGLALEADNADAALNAYREAVKVDACRLDARINLGRLLHERGAHADAEKVYRDAIGECGADALLLYNLGVLLEDVRRDAEAMAAYASALRGDPDNADCHYNLALLCERLGKPREAIRHMSQYRRLTATASP
jgi:tetratricopeptide (TPR) repeat protein